MNSFKRDGRPALGVVGALGALALVGALVVAVIALPVAARSQNPGTPPPTSASTSASSTAVPAWGSGMMNGWGPAGHSGQGGQGMMDGRGGMMGGYPGQPAPPAQPMQPATNGTRLSGAQVRTAVTNYLSTYYNYNTQNQDLAIDEIMEFQNNFYAQIKEQSTGINAFEVLIDPDTGYVRPEYGPNMMWNTKYGPMGNAGRGGMGCGGGGRAGGTPTAVMPVNAQAAVQDAQRYLDAQGGSLTAEGQPDTFYGYYTIDILKAGQIQGMLSVNGYSGQVWYHTWHGSFIGMVSDQ